MPGDIRSFFGAAAPKKPAAEPKADATKSDVVMVDLTDEPAAKPAAKPAASPARPAPTPVIEAVGSAVKRKPIAIDVRLPEMNPLRTSASDLATMT
jgi:hypothetical protein